MKSGDIFDSLMDQIHCRAKERPQGSYTTKLIEGGITKMGAKILEEVLEVTLAAEKFAATTADGDEKKTEFQHLISEAGDVLYHLWVLLGSQGVTAEQLRDELRRREGVSGIVEKLSRKKPESNA